LTRCKELRRSRNEALVGGGEVLRTGLNQVNLKKGPRPKGEDPRKGPRASNYKGKRGHEKEEDVNSHRHPQTIGKSPLRQRSGSKSNLPDNSKKRSKSGEAQDRGKKNQQAPVKSPSFRGRKGHKEGQIRQRGLRQKGRTGCCAKNQKPTPACTRVAAKKTTVMTRPLTEKRGTRNKENPQVRRKHVQQNPVGPRGEKCPEAHLGEKGV